MTDETRWKHLRDAAFRRDHFRCRECARFGKQVPAERAHHAWPADEFPEFRWELWNLVSLCKSCHDKMHVRGSRELTDRGRAWMRRCHPPPGSLAEKWEGPQLGAGR